MADLNGTQVIIKSTGKRGVIIGTENGKYKVSYNDDEPENGGIGGEGGDQGGHRDRSEDGSYKGLDGFLDKLEQRRSDIDKKRAEGEEALNNGHRPGQPPEDNHGGPTIQDIRNVLKNSNQKDRAEILKNMKDLVEKAIKDARDAKERERGDGDNKGGSSDGGDAEQDLDDFLTDAQLQKITSLYKPRSSKDWKKKINRILQISNALAPKMDYNVPSKKDEDLFAREIDIKKIKNVVIMLDCSGSMGLQQFMEVTDYMTEVMPQSKLANATYHVIPWGSGDPARLAKDASAPMRGWKRAMQYLMKYSKGSGGTDMLAALKFLLTAPQYKKMDLCLVLTDGKYYTENLSMKDGGRGSGGEYMEILRFFSNATKKKRVYWIYCKEHEVSHTLNFDPSARSDDRIVEVTD